MDRATRSELVKTVEAQKDKLRKYESKLRDIITAYKGVVKEKEALEESLKVLSSVSTPAPTKTEPARADTGAAREDGGEAQLSEAGADPLNASGMQSESDEVSQLKDQLAHLSKSLATFTQDKAKMEANFLAEKKKYKQEHEEAMEKNKVAHDHLEGTVQELQTQLTEWKARLRSQQHEREKEENDHAMMIRELQKLLANERNEKEHLESLVEELKHALSEKPKALDMFEEHEKRVSDLCQELEATKRRLRESEERAAKPSPMVLQIQREMADIKAQHRIGLQQEQMQTHMAEDKLELIAKGSEDRVSLLEAKLSELSDVVGNYERFRTQDQMTIHKLRERLTQLDLENTALAKAAHTANFGEMDADTSDLDVETLVEKIVNLKGILKVANERAERPVNITALFQDDEVESLEGSTLHTRCQEEYQQLREEFERYKLRAQSVLKTKGAKEPTTSKEVDTLKSQVSELKERLRNLRVDMDEQETKERQKIESLHKMMDVLQDKQKHELANQEADFRHRIADLETEIRRHRDRTIALLAEKDQELQVLRANSPGRESALMGHHYRHQLSSQSSEPEVFRGEIGASSEEETAVSQLLSRTSLGGSTPAETSLLHFAHEQARKDVEINSLRKQKHSLEAALRELQHSTSIKQESYTDEIDYLKEEIRKLERNKSRESANLEYLKNVVYHYMICRESLGKQQMLKAIATILEFSPKETDTVLQEIKGGWWGYKSAAHGASPPRRY